jgi:peptidoglycan/xylan/chitin deacetylase (PgdA/CDA1 family)
MVAPTRRAVRRAARGLAYASGALGAVHAVRNRDALTSVMFHRVLAADDPRWTGADPRYTVTTDLLAECLAFFARHYTVVSADDIIAARDGGAPLPRRPLLITFDDGWTDTYDAALPVLRTADTPAIVYVVSSTIGARRPFWQERIIATVRERRLDLASLRALAPDAPLSNGADDPLTSARAVIAALTPLPPADRARRLEAVAALDVEPAQRAMATPDELIALRDGGVALGAHGVSHEALRTAEDLRLELREPRTVLAAVAGGPPDSVSFPHGSVDTRVVTEARAAGYRLLATSEGVLNPLRDGRPTSDLVHRIGLTAADITRPDGTLDPSSLAAGLFLRPVRRPDLLDCRPAGA